MEKAIMEMSQYVTFALGGETFALNIASVREILEMTSITRVPNVAENLSGVINLRGHALPVFDLRRTFGMQWVEPTVNTCIIVTETVIDGELSQIGIMVDAVNEVVEIEPEAIEPPPRLGNSVDIRFLHGMAKLEDEFVMVLDLGGLYSEDGLVSLEDGAAAMEAIHAGAIAAEGAAAEAV